MRRTVALVKLAMAIMDRPNDTFWGYQLTKQAGISSGVLYPILSRMLADGWLTCDWEDPNTTDGRPPRRNYQLTDVGHRELGAVLARAQNEARFSGLNWGYAR